MAEALSFTEVLLILLRVTVTMVPAMTANTFAPFLGGGKPVDFGITRPDGRRYLGDGKTWRGFIGGSAGASLLGLSLLVIMHTTGILEFEDSLWGPLPHSIVLIIALAVGSLFGDILGSFMKRALNRPRGTRTPFLDQWDYIIGAVIFILPFYPWWYDHLIADYNWIGSVLFLAVAMIAHIIANRIGYIIGVKKEPW
ncbi:MAG: CDP-2,3-bis-(O-geranylgeranyl)-sn-glycerol synthase [Thermoplasmatota archaeon]